MTRPYRRTGKTQLVRKAQPPEVGSQSREMLAWAAGFLEGEGYLSFDRICATQVDIEPLERMLELFGGSISRTERQPPRREVHRWNVYGRANCFAIMQLIEPWLCSRKRMDAISAVGVRSPGTTQQQPNPGQTAV